MNIYCTQENLSFGLSLISHIAVKNISLPILNNILLQVKDNGIKILSTNLEVGMYCTIRGKIEAEGEITIQAKLFSELIHLLPKEKIHLWVSNEKEPNVLYIQTQDSETKIKGVSATEFPLIPQVERKNPFVCSSKLLKLALSQTLFAVSVNESRPEISGILFDFNQKQLTLAATDSFRLAEKKLPVQYPHEGQQQKIIIPSRTAQELLRILSNLKESIGIDESVDVKMYISENQILFSFGSAEMISRLIEGQYPNYKEIIPQKFDTHATVQSSLLLNAAKKASLFSRSGIYDINLDFDPEKNSIMVSSGSGSFGESKTHIPAKINGGKNHITVNHRFLLDGIQNLNTDEALIQLINSTNPCVIAPVEKGADYLYIIMPIK